MSSSDCNSTDASFNWNALKFFLYNTKQPVQSSESPFLRRVRTSVPKNKGCVLLPAASVLDVSPPGGSSRWYVGHSGEIHNEQLKDSSFTATDWRVGDMQLIEHTRPQWVFVWVHACVQAHSVNLLCLRMAESQLQSSGGRGWGRESITAHSHRPVCRNGSDEWASPESSNPTAKPRHGIHEFQFVLFSFAGAL